MLLQYFSAKPLIVQRLRTSCDTNETTQPSGMGSSLLYCEVGMSDSFCPAHNWLGAEDKDMERVKVERVSTATSDCFQPAGPCSVACEYLSKHHLQDYHTM
jgi:hypothetical protein